MQDFHSLGLPQLLVQSLEKMNFSTPTPIQAQAIPVALEGKDVLGSAQTGTGKTAAFGIPLVAKLLHNPRGSALVLTPTRELAVQVLDTLHQLLGKNSGIKTALLIGGEPMPKQFQQLKARPRLIVGTPGRINDHLTRGTLMLHDTNFLVLDETDRMLDLGFGVQLDQILKFLTGTRQTLMFSATLPHNIVKLSQKYLTDPVRISVGSTTEAAPKIKQELVHTNDAEKYEQLLTQLEQRTGSIIIFVKTKRNADKLAIKLNRQNHQADAIHGDLRQNRRDRVIHNFRNSKFRILVATDVAARGLDIPHIEHVINYDLPQCPEDYIHRIGRTARAGAEGAAVCLLTPADGGKWKEIHKLMHPGEKSSPVGQKGGASKERGDTHRRQGSKKTGYGQKNNDGYAPRHRNEEESNSEGGNADGGNRRRNDRNDGYKKRQRNDNDYTPRRRDEGEFGASNRGNKNNNRDGGYKKRDRDDSDNYRANRGNHPNRENHENRGNRWDKEEGGRGNKSRHNNRDRGDAGGYQSYDDNNSNRGESRGGKRFFGGKGKGDARKETRFNEGGYRSYDENNSGGNGYRGNRDRQEQGQNGNRKPKGNPRFRDDAKSGFFGGKEGGNKRNDYRKRDGEKAGAGAKQGNRKPYANSNAKGNGGNGKVEDGGNRKLFRFKGFRRNRDQDVA